MLVYAGLWTQCSKNGVFKWKPRSLKLDILPFLDFDMGNTLAILERHGFIIRFAKDGEEYGYIPKFLEHQAISHKEKDAPSTYPDYVEPQPGTVPEPSRNSSRPDPDTADIGHRTYDIGHRTKDEGQRTRDNGALELPSISGPISGANRDIFAGLLQTFLQVNGGKLPNMDTETRAIYELMQKTDNDPAEIQAIVEAYETLTKSGDKFWQSKPMLPSWIIKDGIWEQVRAQAMRKADSINRVLEASRRVQAKQAARGRV